jgi:hypothetical protein
MTQTGSHPISLMRMDLRVSLIHKKPRVGKINGHAKGFAAGFAPLANCWIV